MFNNFQKLILAGLLITVPLSGYAATCANDRVAENTAINATTDHFDVISPSIIPGEVYDSKTNLTWQRCSIGRDWNEVESTCPDFPDNTMSWPAALAAAKIEADATGLPWRLPNIKELNSIVEQRCYSPTIDSDIFPVVAPLRYWSSSPYANDDRYAWTVNFDRGESVWRSSFKSSRLRVLLVRSGQ